MHDVLLTHCMPMHALLPAGPGGIDADESSAQAVDVIGESVGLPAEQDTDAAIRAAAMKQTAVSSETTIL